MTGKFSADSQPAAAEKGEREGGRAKSKADRKRPRCFLSHQLMGAAVIESIFTLS